MVSTILFMIRIRYENGLSFRRSRHKEEEIRAWTWPGYVFLFFLPPRTSRCASGPRFLSGNERKFPGWVSDLPGEGGGTAPGKEGRGSVRTVGERLEGLTRKV